MQLVIISGPPNAGKSSTADALCQRYDRMLHIDVSVLRDFLRMGRLRPWDESPEGRRQRELLIRSACDMARRFLDAGYGVVIDDIVLPEDLPAYREGLSGVAATMHFVVLLPALDVVLEREAGRPSMPISSSSSIMTGFPPNPDRPGGDARLLSARQAIRL